MKIAIIGAGAIGSIYGYRLHQSGADVFLQTRSGYSVVKNKGFSIQSPWGDGLFHPTGIVETVEDLSCYGPFDYVIVTTKVYPSVDRVSLLMPVVSDKTVIVLIQNGIAIEQPIYEYYPNNELLSGLAFICVTRTASGHIIHQDYGRLVIGKYPFGFSSQANELAVLFDKGGVPCQLTERIQFERWKKLVWNVPFNPISVVSGGLTTQQILLNPELKQKIRLMMQEVCQVARIEGFDLDESIIEKNIQDTEKMTPYKTSMLEDYEAGRLLEIDAILGNFIAIAQSHGILVSESEFVYQQIQQLVS
jgi:2-dehydropantoate 2-reductase